MKRFYPIVYLLCIIAVTHFAVKIFYKVAQSHVPSTSESQIKVKRMRIYHEEELQPFSSYAAIIDRNLFQTKTKAMEKAEAEAVAKASETKVEKLKPTELKLKLIGTVAGDKRSAYAVIEDLKKKKQDLYREGDSIQTASLFEIRRRSVILKVGNDKEILSMEEELDKGKGSKDGPGKKSEDIISLSRSEMEKSLRNINQLMSNIRIRPHFNRGKPDGLSVNNIRRKSVFSKMGLKNGDIIQGVNDNAITSVDDVMALYKNLKSDSDVNLQIKRRGKVQTLNYSIE
ncbi:general secretion pathway protein C [Candidatus Magnetomoraceae bacterium gMMP-15]